jgi:hypothetical protein
MKALSFAAALLLAAVAVVAVHAETVHAEFPGDTTTVPFQNFSPPIACCITITAKGGDIVLDLDKGTIDLGGAKLDDGARAFWDAVRKIAGRNTTVQHAYTLDDIDRMRVAEREIAAWASASNPLDSVVELRVQTDIAAGITPEDLERKITAKP